METQSFVLGILTTYGLLITSVVVVGLVKINNLMKKQQIIEKINSDFKLEVQANERNVFRILEDTNREITMVERTIMQRIDSETNHGSSVEDDIRREIKTIDVKHHNILDNYRSDVEKKLELSISYTDSRFDKAVSLINTKKTIV